MIELITGLPGNAKTLYGIAYTIERAKRENRPVYYFGLKEFKTDDPRLQGTEWIEFDPVTWHETVPSGAIIFGDEAQKVFRNRSLGSVPGKHVTELEEHRHKGLDFHLITQHPGLIDPAIRKLTQVHTHMVRVWGMEVSTVHKWNGVKDNCDKNSSRADSEKTKWKFRKDLYGLYKSADLHTMKAKIPFRVKLLIALSVVFVALVAYMVLYLKSKTNADNLSAPGAVAAAGGAGVHGVPSYPGQIQPGQAPDRSLPPDPMVDLQNYAWRDTPRVSGLPHTAPKYDQITEPVRAPIPAACIQVGQATSRKVDCKCFTQQGTPMAVEFNMCVEFARNGYFQDFDAERDRERSDRAATGERVLAGRPDEPIRSGSQVVAFARVPDDAPRVQGITRN